MDLPAAAALPQCGQRHDGLDALARKDLAARGFRNIRRWTRGVDTDLFRPRGGSVLDAQGPKFLYVGRVAVEKNLEAFLSLDLPGTKIVVGDGPARSRLEARYPDARFLGKLAGQALAEVYSSADVFVFPSLTDTFGIVLLEALASGLPIAAFPVTGPLDVVGTSGCGTLNHDLRQAALEALAIPKDLCRAYGETFTWRESAASSSPISNSPTALRTCPRVWSRLPRRRASRMRRGGFEDHDHPKPSSSGERSETRGPQVEKGALIGTRSSDLRSAPSEEDACNVCAASE